MNKRQFIDTVRQFAAKAQRKGVSYAAAVNALHGMYMQRNVDAGMSEAELTKEGDWAEAFILREYAKFDKDFSLTDGG